MVVQSREMMISVLPRWFSPQGKPEALEDLCLSSLFGRDPEYQGLPVRHTNGACGLAPDRLPTEYSAARVSRSRHQAMQQSAYRSQVRKEAPPLLIPVDILLHHIGEDEEMCMT